MIKSIKIILILKNVKILKKNELTIGERAQIVITYADCHEMRYCKKLDVQNVQNKLQLNVQTRPDFTKIDPKVVKNGSQCEIGSVCWHGKIGRKL